MMTETAGLRLKGTVMGEKINNFIISSAAVRPFSMFLNSCGVYKHDHFVRDRLLM